jgi:hypothetical protein
MGAKVNHSLVTAMPYRLSLINFLCNNCVRFIIIIFYQMTVVVLAAWLALNLKFR